jgi:hypothetical protein
MTIYTSLYMETSPRDLRLVLLSSVHRITGLPVQHIAPLRFGADLKGKIL